MERSDVYLENVRSTSPERLQFPSRARAQFTLGVLLAAYIVSYLDRQIISLMVGPIKADLGISDFQISLLQGTAFGVFFALAGLPLGWMADRLSRVRLIAAGLLLWSLMTILCGFASSFWMLFFARVGLGVGEAALAPAGFSILADTFPRDRLVRATGIFASGGILGGGLAYFVGGYLIDYLTHTSGALSQVGLKPWQLAFMFVSIPGFLLILPIFFLGEPQRLGASDDKPGVRKTCAYLWDRRRDFAPFFLTPTLLGVANYSGLAWFPTHLIRHFGVSPKDAGMWLGGIQVIASVIGMLGGAMLTEFFARRGRHDANLITIFCISLLCIGGLSATLVPNLNIALAVWFFAVVSFSGYFGSVVAAIQILTPPEMRSSNSALLLMVIIIGGLAGGVALVGAVSDVFFSGLADGIGYSLFLVGGFAALLSAIVAWRALPRTAEVMRQIQQ